MEENKNTKWHLVKSGKYLVNLGAAFTVLVTVAPMVTGMVSADTRKSATDQTTSNNLIWTANTSEQVRHNIEVQGKLQDMDHYQVQ